MIDNYQGYHWYILWMDHLYVSDNILITFLIVMSWLDVHKSVLQPMGIRWSMVIKQLSQMDNMVYGIICEQICEDGEIWHLLVFVRNELGVLAKKYDCVNIKNASLHYYTVSYTEMMGSSSKHSYQVQLNIFGSIKLYC